MNITLTKGQFKKLSKISKIFKGCETRPALSKTIHFTKYNESYELAATNGFILYKEFGDEKQILELFNQFDRTEFSLSFDSYTCKKNEENQEIEFMENINYFLNNREFPKYNHIIPVGSPTGALNSICFGADIYRDLLKLMKAIDMNTYEMQFYGALKPVKIECKDKKITLIIMPRKS